MHALLSPDIHQRLATRQARISMNRLPGALVLLALMASPPLWAEPVGAQAAVQLVTIDSRPVSWCEQGEAHGFDVDIIRSAFERMHRAVSIRCVTFKRGLEMIQQGEADGFFPAFMTTERRAYAVYPNTPLHISPFMLFTRKGESRQLPTYAALHGKRVGINSGNDIGTGFDQGRQAGDFRVEEVSSIEQDLYNLVSGRVDVIVSNRFATLFTARQMGLAERIDFQPLPENTGRPSYLIFSRASALAQHSDFYDELNRTLSNLWKDGSVRQAMHNYGN